MLLFTGSRLWLYFHRRSDLGELTLGERLKLFWVGFRLDSVIVSRSCVLLVLLALFLTDSHFAMIRQFLLAYLGILYFTFFFAEIGGFYFFRYYDVRPNYPLFERGTDREVLRRSAKAIRLGALSL